MSDNARATFPGVAKIIGVQATLGHGTIPTGFRITTTPQPSAGVRDVGTLRLLYRGDVLEFPNCRVDRASFVFDRSGFLVELRILDRRWQWALTRFVDGAAQGVYGRISGNYNVRREDGTIRKKTNGNPALAIEDSERTPQQLGELLLKAAGEYIAFDALSDLPNDVRPEVAWDGANPMAELANLAELLGCRVVLGTDNRVRVKRAGVGAALPTTRLLRLATDAPIQPMPDRLRLLTGYVRVQVDFKLRAVGLDVDGNRKPYDQLSYWPANGADAIDVLTKFSALDSDAPVNLAQRSLFREYQIEVPFLAPQFGFIDNLEQIELLGSQVDKETIDGMKRPRDAMVYGCWYRAYDVASENSTASRNATNTVEWIPPNAFSQTTDTRLKQIVTEGFSIDPQNWLVRFNSPVYMMTTGNGIAPATLYLRTSCFIKWPDTGAIIRKEQTRIVRNGSPAYCLDLPHDEITPTVRSSYNASMLPDSVQTNDDEIALEIDHYLTEAYNDVTRSSIPQTGHYGGWRFDVPLDGAIQAITWSVSSTQEPVTIIERSDDRGRGGIPYEVTRVHQRNADAQRKASQQEWRLKQLRYLLHAKGGK